MGRENRELSQKGQWGRAIPIADDYHPNLYYNRSEIDELRDMILVKQNPERLCHLYASMRDVKAQGVTAANESGSEFDSTQSFQINRNNFKAAINYMIEPTDEKADCIKAALLSFMRLFTDGLYYNSDWYNSQSTLNGYTLPWLFDLIQGYHPEWLTVPEKTDLKEWFKKGAKNMQHAFTNREQIKWIMEGEPGFEHPIIREGKTVVGLANWFSRDMGPSLACAFVSGSQDEVDFWADSGWPHDMLDTEDITGNWPPESCNLCDMVMYLLGIFPSGANYDTYVREGYNNEERTYHTTCYTGGGYHFGQMAGLIMGAEMAYHNGMTRVFEITDAGEPALLRGYKHAVRSRSHKNTWFAPYYLEWKEASSDTIKITLDTDKPSDVAICIMTFGDPQTREREINVYFRELEGVNQVLEGVYKGIDFGTGQFILNSSAPVKHQLTFTDKYISFKQNSVLIKIPEGKVLKGLQLASLKGTEVKISFESGSNTSIITIGHPLIGYESLLFPAFRRYSDPELEAAIPMEVSFPGYEIQPEVAEFFAYPKRVVWPPAK